MPTPEQIEAKRRIRAEGRRLRRELADKPGRSKKIVRALREMPEYLAAKTVMFYVNSPTEVGTRELIEEELRGERCVVVPYCDGGELRLFRLEDMAELSPGEYGIDEPLPQLRDFGERSVRLEEIDLVIVPGTAFDRRGGRIGQGKGFYDRFLKTLDEKTVFIALAYECQIFSSVPVEEYDMTMDAIVTEENIYRIE